MEHWAKMGEIPQSAYHICFSIHTDIPFERRFLPPWKVYQGYLLVKKMEIS